MRCVSPEEFRSLPDAFAYFAECQLATVEGLRLKKRAPKYELERQQSIADGMVDVARQFNLRVEERGFSRLRKALAR